MDTFRGNFGSAGYDGDQDGYDPSEDETGRDLPPAAIGTDERRMQVRAYNHWASLLQDRHFPSIEDLEPENLPDFGPYGVLLDFTSGIEDPAILHLGKELAEECGTGVEIEQLSDIPSRSLLSRITDHYMQILANQAPIGFEAEFVNQRDATILYRGILLPYSSDGETIDFIFGVINWKEMADEATTDELLLDLDQALEESEPQVGDRVVDPVTDWADGPAAIVSEDSETTFPEPAFGVEAEEVANDDADESEDDVVSRLSSLIQPSVDEDGVPTPKHTVDDILARSVKPQTELHDCLAEARELAQRARTSEDRTRQALYAAVGRAYDVSLAAEESPEEFEELVAENGLTIQERAPMTPVVKLVFGSDYDKTRLTEYAAVLSHAQRAGIERGALAQFLSDAEGGLKSVVQAERRIRKEESGKKVDPIDAVRPALAKKLRKVESRSLDSIDTQGEEFGVVMIRRTEDGDIVVLGEIADDIALVEKVGRKLLG